MIKAIIFDLDDTLVAEKQYIESGYKHISRVVAAKYQLDEEEIFIQLINLFNFDSRYVFNRLLDKLKISYTSDTIKNLVDEYRNHKPLIDYYSDVLPCTVFTTTF